MTLTQTIHTEEYPSKLAMKVTDIVLNKEPYWSRELETVLKAEKKRILQAVVLEIEKLRMDPMPDHECGEELCPHYPRTEATNRLIDTLKTTLIEAIEK